MAQHTDKIRNLKAFVRGYAHSDNGKKVVSRPQGHVPTGKTYQAAFYSLRGNAIKIENKAVRETVWRNPALAQALIQAAQ